MDQQGISNNLVIVTDTSTHTLSTAFSTVYTYTGVGMLYGFQLIMSVGTITTKLTVDGNIVYSQTSTSVAGTPFDFSITTYDSVQQGSLFRVDPIDMDFSTRQPIQYRTSVLIECKSASGTPTVTGVLVALTKEV